MCIRDSPIIVYTGHLYPSKGVYILAESSRYLREAQVLIVGGTPEDLKQLQCFIQNKQLKRVVLQSYVPPYKIPLFQQAADVLVNPQLGLESQCPLKIFEYMAARRPIVASDLPTLREILRHEENALLASPGEPVELARAIQRVLDNPSLAKKLANNSFKYVQQWTWEKRAKIIIENSQK